MAGITRANCRTPIWTQAAYVPGAAVAIILWLGSPAMAGEMPNPQQSIENHVATDAEKRFEIAQQQGDKIQTCVQAALVATAYQQAKDDASYKMWKNIQFYVCDRRGLHP